MFIDFHPTSHLSFRLYKQAESSPVVKVLLKKELETSKANLRLIQLRISEYVMSTEVPLQPIKNGTSWKIG